MPRKTTTDQRIARLSSLSHGVVTRKELLQAGITNDEIRERLEKGALLTQHPGVYRVGHEAPSIEARYIAAVRAAGLGAVLSDRAAGHLLSLTRGRPPAPEVTAPTKRRIKGVITHRRNLDPADTTTHRGIPITTPGRTLTDLAALLSVDDLARACHEAGVKYGTAPRHVNAVLARRPRCPGAAKLRAVTTGEQPVALSKLEKRFSRLLADNDLPHPAMNRKKGSHRIDCRWETPPLTVELDSYRYHNSRHAWEQDRRREREARARGDDFRRFTWGDVTERPAATLAELRAALRQ